MVPAVPRSTPLFRVVLLPVCYLKRPTLRMSAKGMSIDRRNAITRAAPVCCEPYTQ